MLLHELLTAHRDEIFGACRAELAHAAGSADLGQYILEHFQDIVTLLVPGNRAAMAASDGDLGVAPLLGSSPAMAHVRADFAQLTRRSRASVLIFGEAGTGASACAGLLHRATYPEGAWFELESESQLSELETRLAALRILSSAQSAAGLTILVPNLSAACAEVQARLPALLAERSLPLRVIATDSSEAFASGKKRAGIACQFANELALPPLRERAEDIAEAVHYFVERVVSRSGVPATRFGESALERMKEHAWPRNLQELSAFVTRISTQFGAETVEATDLPELGARPSGVYFTLPSTGVDLAQLERDLLSQALVIAENNQTKAASLLGLTRDQFRYRMAKFALVGSR